MQIKPDTLDDPRVIELLRFHFESARAQTAPGSAHALDLGGLKAPGIRFRSIWEGETLLGIGAWKRLDADHGEVKSMHTASGRRGRGVGSALLAHLMGDARANGVSRLSLETGSSDYFRPAVALYARHGFTECGPFGDYRLDPNSVFMTRQLGEPGERNVQAKMPDFPADPE